MADRGVLFAPVHFRRNVWASPGYYYTPSIVVSLNLFTDHLWVRPRCNHYYFGDYYAPRYADLGFYAGYSWHRHRRGYDPIWAYDRWEHRRDRDWERRYEDNFNFFRNNDRFRPPHTWAAMRGLGNERLEGGRNRLFASSFASMVNNPDRRQQFRSLDREGRDRFVAQSREMRDFGRQRRNLEATKIAAADRAQNAEDRNKGVFREKLRRSPVAGREAVQFAKNEGPPKRPEGRGRAALKEAATANAANPDRKGQGRDLAGRQGQRDGVAPGRGGLAGKGQDQGREGPGKDPSVAQQERGKAQRKKQAQDGQAKLKQQQREKATPERQVQPKPQREKVAPERQVQPKQQQREKVAPERQAQPKQQQREKAAPQQRDAQPKRQVVPERKAQPQQPQRQAQPRQPQVKPQQNRQAKEKDKAQASVTPKQRSPQANVQRAAQPKPQVQRQAQPRQQQKAAPKPQARPQQQARPQAQQRQAQPRQQQQARPQQRQAQPRQQQSRPQQQQQRQNKKTAKKDTA